MVYTPSYLIKKRKKAQTGKIVLILIIFLFILILGFIYFLQTNSLVSQGYLTRKYQQELKDLKEEHNKLQIEVSQSQSLMKLQEAIQNFNLVPADRVSYLKAGEGEAVFSQVFNP